MRYEPDDCWCPCHLGLPERRTVPTTCDLCAPLHVEAPRRERPTVSAGAHHFPRNYQPFIPDPPPTDDGPE